MNKRVFLIDHQSFNSLAAYDWNMIENVKGVEIFFFGNEGYNEKPFNENVKFYPVFRYNRYKNKICRALSYLFSLLRIMFYGLRFKPAILHMQWIRIWACDWLLIRCFKKCLHSKFIFTVHNLLPRHPKKNTRSHFALLYQIADILIAHTETSKKELIKEFGIPDSKIVVMPHGLLDVPVSEKDLEKSKTKLEDKFQFGDKLVFAALGAQTTYKGTDLLVNAWMATPSLAQNNDIVLLVAGKNMDLTFPENLPKNICLIEEMVSNPDFRYLMQRSDVVVLPYRVIDQSGLLLSIIMGKKPYCATQVGELTQPFIISDVGWTIPEVTEESVANTIIQIVNNPEEIQRKRDNTQGWRKLHSEYSWKRSNEILEESYHKLLRNR